MREFIKHLYYDTTIGYWLISPAETLYDGFRNPKTLYDIYCHRIIPEKIFLKRTFKEKLGYDLNLENPKTFNEKIQWLKLNDRKPLHTLCADKYAVREYIKEKIGEQYLVPLVYHTDNPADIVPENLPDLPCIIKTNHSNGGAIIVKDKSKIDWKHVQRKLARSLKSNFYYHTKEWQYKNIQPRIIVEKLLLDKNLNIPFDYKFHCFNGRLLFIQVDIDRYIDHKRNIYDPDWNFMDFQLKYENGDDVEKPDMLNKMKSLAEILAKDFRYIRVDFYNLGSEVYFGELTLHPGSGFETFTPPEWDRKWGDKLIL